MAQAKKPKFLRRVWNRHSKLGKGRKKIQRWKKPTGRDNKMREKRRGYPAVVSIGYKKSESSRRKIMQKDFVIVNNLKDLEKASKNKIIIIGKVGKKKKIEILQKAKEMKLEIYKTNPDKFIKKNTKQKKEENKKKNEKEDIKKKIKENKESK